MHISAVWTVCSDAAFTLDKAIMRSRTRAHCVRKVVSHQEVCWEQAANVHTKRNIPINYYK